ncbi:DedA family protein [Bhargavaea cecembensis]|uniref:DedA family protein n=1 Tax=Bhargavaea cecembensis TaxID=394098 RepID=UPI00058D43E6|nr:DedA family protein [Bhargavaea cecembensis]
MGIDAVMGYIQQYGYVIIFLLAVFGIVGIPAPEESMVFFTGMLIAGNQLGAAGSILCTVLGAFTGMMIAYSGGRWVGSDVLQKLGRRIGLTKERFEKMEGKFRKRRMAMIVFGFYLPGLRQVSPYIAGIAKTPLPLFAGLSLTGALLWTGPFLLAGYILGNLFDIDPLYAGYAGILFLLIYIFYLAGKSLRKRIRQSRNTPD